LLSSFWSDLKQLMQEPQAIVALAALLIFLALWWMIRAAHRVGAELERRKGLSDYVRGLDEFLRGDFRDAIATLDAVLERDPENVEARIALGDSYREMGDAAEAKKHHHHVFKVFGHELARNFVSLGLDDLGLRHYQQAVESFEKAAEDPTQRDAALSGMARAYAIGGDAVAAAETLRRLYPDGPMEEMPHRARRDAAKRFAEAGKVELENDSAEGAIRFFTEALAFDPRSLRARTGLVRAAHALGDPERAKELVEKHLAVLRELADDENVLFEPAAASKAAPVDEEPVAAIGPGASFLPAKVDEVGGVVAAVEQKTARYVCAQCGALHRTYADQCSVCHTVGTVEALPEVAAGYTAPVSGFRDAVDEVEENAAFVQALARKASEGDDVAVERLVGVGPSAVYEIFAVLPSVQNARLLGQRFAAVGAAALAEVRRCHGARAGSMLGPGRPADEFVAAMYVTLEEAPDLLGRERDRALAALVADPALDAAVRDRARDFLSPRGMRALAPLVESIAATEDPGGVARAAELVGAWGAAAVADIEKTYLQSSLLGRLFKGKTGARRRVCASMLAASGVAEAAATLGRAAASEKDSALRDHYLKAKERAES